jgi:phosphate transport system substrate-binding protein
MMARNPIGIVAVLGILVSGTPACAQKVDPKLPETKSAEGVAQQKVDAKLSEYKSVAGVSGNLKSVGSDTMNNEMAFWSEGFRKFYPNVQTEIEGKGSGTAPVALIAGTAHFGPMSRPMKGKEKDDFKKQYGYAPTALTTSIDMLAVYVHKDNPIKGLSLKQVDAIFSRTRKGGHGKPINTWGDAGLTGEWANKPIAMYGRNAASGTYGYFKEHALFDGDFRDEVKEQPGSASVVQEVASDKYAIGYSGIAYKTADVRAIPISIDEKSDLVPAEADKAYSGDYPLARPLLVYVNYQPGTKLDSLRGEFIRYVFSKQGQLDVVKTGYLPVPNTIAKKALKSVGLE